MGQYPRIFSRKWYSLLFQADHVLHTTVSYLPSIGEKFFSFHVLEEKRQPCGQGHGSYPLWLLSEQRFSLSHKSVFCHYTTCDLSRGYLQSAYEDCNFFANKV